MLGSARPRWPTWIRGPTGDGRRWPAGLGQHVPACGTGQVAMDMPAGGGHGRTFLGTFRLCGPGRPFPPAQAEWQGLCGPLVLRAPGGPARGPPVLGVFVSQADRTLSYGKGHRREERLTLGSCPPGTFPGMACPLTRVSPSLQSYPSLQQGRAYRGAWAPGWEPSTQPEALESQLRPVPQAEAAVSPPWEPTPTVRKTQLGNSVNPQNTLPLEGRP